MEPNETETDRAAFYDAQVARCDACDWTQECRDALTAGMLATADYAEVHWTAEDARRASAATKFDRQYDADGR